jgi:hypothetical protein
MTQYIKDGMLQEAAMMNRELAGKIKIECPPLSLPSNAGQGGNDKAGSNFPYDYYTSVPTITYPDKNTDKTMCLPGVIIYDSPRSVGQTTRYPLALSRGFVSFFEAALKKAYEGVVIGDRRFSQTPDHIWNETRNYNRDENNNSGGIEVTSTGVIGGKRYTVKFRDLHDAFTRSSAVALRVNLTCTMKLQAQVTKGMELPPNAEARPVIIPTQITVLGPVDIAEPVVTTGRRTQVSDRDNADESFMDMLMKQNEEDDDDDEEKANQEEDDDDEDDE